MNAPRLPTEDPNRICVKVFSATMHKERDLIGDVVTRWLRDQPRLTVTEIRTMQSSDSNFHCVTIIVFGTIEVPS